VEVEMKLPLADILDRYSIELRKAFYGHGNAQLLEELQRALRDYLRTTSSVSDADRVFSMIHAAIHLGLHNSSIACLEWQLRAKDPKITLEEHGRRAVAIRHINDEGRVKAKQALSKALGENVEERHYGYGDLIQAEQITKDVQPIDPIWEHMMERFRLEQEKPRPPRQEGGAT
jgi:hypothetical protein